MISETSKTRVLKFLESHKSPSVRVITTLKDNEASCIEPIRTICDAEIHCASNSYDDVLRLIKEQQ